MRKFRSLDYVAMAFAKLLPIKRPNLRHMEDEDFISLLSWCEDWEPQTDYETAYKESRIDPIQTWDEWADDMKPLPPVVRTELERAVLLHDGVGTMGALMTYAFFQSWASRLAWCTFWAFVTVILIRWIA